MQYLHTYMHSDIPPGLSPKDAHLGFCIPLWDPQGKSDMELLDLVQ